MRVGTETVKGFVMCFSVMKYIGTVMIVSVSLLLTGCALKSRNYAAPSLSEYEKANVVGYKKNIRYWGDETASFAYLNLKKFKKNKSNHKRVDVLALSGGGENGAYGAGVLNGWSQRGDRPEFAVVTGISAGAIIAPFAFLGPKYDRVIKKLFTENSKENVFSPTPISALLGGPAMGIRHRLEAHLKRRSMMILSRNWPKKLTEAVCCRSALPILMPSVRWSGISQRLQNPVILMQKS